MTLLIGSNDLFRKEHRDELPGTFERLLAELPTGAVVATMPQPRQAAIAVNAAIARASAERGIVAADMRGGGPKSWKGKLAQDHFHPNDLGYAGIGDVFFAAITAGRAQPAEPPATT